MKMGTLIMEQVKEDKNKDGYRKGLSYKIEIKNPTPLEILFLNYYEKTGFIKQMNSE